MPLVDLYVIPRSLHGSTASIVIAYPQCRATLTNFECSRRGVVDAAARVLDERSEHSLVDLADGERRSIDWVPPAPREP